MLELLGYAGQFLFGGALYSLPLFNGLVSLLLIAFAGGFLAKIFRIERTLSCVALAGILTTFPRGGGAVRVYVHGAVLPVGA